MPCLLYPLFVVHDCCPYDIKFFWSEALILRQYDWRQPEFAKHILPLDMHMHLLVAIKAVEE